jgi:hypothetical protein
MEAKKVFREIDMALAVVISAPQRSRRGISIIQPLTSRKTKLFDVLLILLFKKNPFGNTTAIRSAKERA